MLLFTLKKLKISTIQRHLGKQIHYIQGQSPEPKIREYFYFIDHQGQLFLDDARMKNFTSCFKERAFLEFFFKRLKFNNTSRYREDFPYLSLCGRERNFIRCDDKPIVYTDIINLHGQDVLIYGGAGAAMSVLFEPDKICMMPTTGRVYHPADIKTGGVGLIKSSLAIEFSKHFEFEKTESEPPTHFTWNETRHILTNEVIPLMEKCPKGMFEIDPDYAAD